MTTSAPTWTMAPPWDGKTPTDDAQDHAEFAWHNHLRHHGYQDAPATYWDVTTAPDGRPMVTCRIVGARAVEALEKFAGHGGSNFGGQDNQRPVMDFTEPGRVSCVWRDNGVWVSLWAVEPTAPATELEHAEMPAPEADPIRTFRALIPWLVTAAGVLALIATAALITH